MCNFIKVDKTRNNASVYLVFLADFESASFFKKNSNSCYLQLHIFTTFVESEKCAGMDRLFFNDVMKCADQWFSIATIIARLRIRWLSMPSLNVLPNPFLPIPFDSDPWPSNRFSIPILGAIPYIDSRFRSICFIESIPESVSKNRNRECTAST